MQNYHDKAVSAIEAIMLDPRIFSGEDALLEIIEMMPSEEVDRMIERVLVRNKGLRGTPAGRMILALLGVMYGRDCRVPIAPRHAALLKPDIWREISSTKGKRYFLRRLVPDQLGPVIRKFQTGSLGYNTHDSPEVVPLLVWFLVHGDATDRQDRFNREHVVHDLRDHAAHCEQPEVWLEHLIFAAKRLLEDLGEGPIRRRDPRPQVWALGGVAWAIRAFASEAQADEAGRHRQPLEDLERKLRIQLLEVDGGNRWDDDFEPSYSWDWSKTGYHPATHIRATLRKIAK